MSERCEVCRGSQYITLPLYRSATAAISTINDPAESVSLDETQRRYPCPECSPKAPDKRVKILRVYAQVDSRYEEYPEATRSIQRNLAHILVDEIEKGGFIEFQKGPQRTQGYMPVRPWRAMLGIISTADVATIEQRALEKAHEIASKFSERSIAEIDNFGSHYGHTQIHKADARRLISDAIQQVIKSFSNWKSAK